MIEPDKTARTFLVRAVSVSIINPLKLHDSFCGRLASIHQPYPFHLGFGIPLLGHAGLLSPLRHEQMYVMANGFAPPNMGRYRVFFCTISGK